MCITIVIMVNYGVISVWPWKKHLLGICPSFFEFGSMASKQNLFGSMALCQFWTANSVKSEVKRPFYP